MLEEWKDIDGYVGLYKVSNFGRVKSYKIYQQGKILKPSLDKDEYLQIGLRDCVGKRKWFRVHRLVAEAFISNPHNYKQINHKDSIPSNCVISNLEWCSIAYNNKYRFSNGNASHVGENHPRAMLSNDVVLEIYKVAWEEKLTQKEIAKMFGVTRSLVASIKCGGKWAGITLHKGASGFRCIELPFRKE